MPANAFQLVPYLAHSSNLKMQATYSSETSNDFQLTRRLYILEYRNYNTLTIGLLVDDRKGKSTS
jgi:hypothetical protein